MTDNDKALVERLRKAAKEDDEYWARERWGQAADHIEAQAAEIERMRAALQKIANGNTSGFPGIDEGINETFARELMACREVARAALGETLHVAETCKENGETFT